MKNKQVFFFLTITIILIMWFTVGAKAVGMAHRLFSSAFFPPVQPLVPRKCDSWGCGNFGASRDGGKRKHKGQDYTVTAGQPVYAPISGTLTTGPAYASGIHPEMRLVKITDGTTAVNLMYVLPSAGGQVSKGERIGTAQSLQGLYPGIPDHIHVEVVIAGVKVDPSPYFEEQKQA